MLAAIESNFIGEIGGDSMGVAVVQRLRPAPAPSRPPTNMPRFSTRPYKLMTSKQMEAFKTGSEPQAVREQVRQDRLRPGCLMARRLVEPGVPFVEVDLGGWDTHANNFTSLEEHRSCRSWTRP